MKAPTPKRSVWQTAIRLPAELLEPIDRIVRERTAAEPGIHFTRSDAIRMLITRGLSKQK